MRQTHTQLACRRIYFWRLFMAALTTVPATTNEMLIDSPDTCRFCRGPMHSLPQAAADLANCRQRFEVFLFILIR